MTLDLSPLRRKLTKKAGEEDSVWPALLLTLYSPLPLRELSPPVAKCVRAYLDLIPNGALRSGLIGDWIKALGSNRIARDLRRLEHPAKNVTIEGLYYFSGANGPPCDYSVTVELWEVDDPEEDQTVSMVRFEFPWHAAEGDAAEIWISQAVTLANLIPFSAGTGGFGFSHWQQDRFARDQVYAMLPHYVGFEHSAWTPSKFMRGKATTANWLTFVDNALLERLGGAQRLHELAPEATVQTIERGAVVRAAHWPVVGDVNRGAPDLGSVPGVARWLEPARVTFPFLRGGAVEVDVPAWLHRFDPFTNGPWDNR